MATRRLHTPLVAHRAAQPGRPQRVVDLGEGRALRDHAVALVLGTMASLAVHRFKFFGRSSISFLIVLPIALPGIVSGIALNRGFNQAGVTLSLFTLIVAHATFCVVVVYNNVLARLRRLSPNLDEAAADLGADTFQAYRYVTFPLIRSALFAGGAPRVRAELRRDRRHDVHGGSRDRDAASVDLQQHRRVRTRCRS